MMCFLSTITLLNKKEFRHTIYHIDGKEADCIQTNESALRYLCHELEEQGEHLDGIFYFASQGTRQNLTIDPGDGLAPFTATHEECFQTRVKALFPDGEAAFHRIDYDENAGADEGIRRITAMTEAIRQYQAETGEEICLHTDMTGGLRYASMMLLSAMQLLKYSGIRIGQVLYSDYNRGVVEDVSDVYRTFTLVSGADEFVNFGSVREIEKYFEGQSNGAVLQKLLDTMAQFSDDINVCRTGDIEDTVIRLRTCLEAFIESGGRTLQEELFLQIADVLRNEYRGLFETKDRLNIIRWCIEKHFLQQAMTLCTEWIPHELVARRICYADRDDVKEQCEAGGASSKQGWEQFFIKTYLPPRKDTVPGPRANTRRNRIAKALQVFQNGGDIDVCLQECAPEAQAVRPFLQEFDEYFTLFDQFSDSERIDIPQLNKKCPRVMRAASIVYSKRRNNSHMLPVKYSTYLRKISVDILLSELQTCNVDQMNELFDLKPESPKVQIEAKKKGKDTSNDWAYRAKVYQDMLEDGVMKSDCPHEVIDILRKYHRIRNARNQINHANKEVSISSSELQQMMTDCLDAIAAHTI